MRPASIPAPVEDLPMRPKLRSRVVAVLAVLCVATASTANARVAAGQTPPTTGDYYVSLGDSYAAGNQPTPVRGLTTTPMGSLTKWSNWLAPRATGSTF